MVLSHLIHTAWNVGSTNAAAGEESMATVTAAVSPIHLDNQVEGDESTTQTCATATKKSTKSSSSAITVEGIELTGHKVVDGIHLKRNGHGLRSLTYFGIGIRIYVASMYTSRPLRSAEEAMGDMDVRPIQLDFTFLRYVRQSQVVSAWTEQLGHSVTHKYEGYEADQKRFIELASGGVIQLGGTQSIVLVGGETKIIDQGKLKGVIRGQDFQRSFLSMWFGDMAVAEDLKANLLRGDEHLREEQLEQEVEQDLSQQQQQPPTLVKAV